MAKSWVVHFVVHPADWPWLLFVLGVIPKIHGSGFIPCTPGEHPQNDRTSPTVGMWATPFWDSSLWRIATCSSYSIQDNHMWHPVNSANSQQLDNTTIQVSLVRNQSIWGRVCLVGGFNPYIVLVNQPTITKIAGTKKKHKTKHQPDIFFNGHHSESIFITTASRLATACNSWE